MGIISGFAKLVTLLVIIAVLFGVYYWGNLVYNSNLEKLCNEHDLTFVETSRLSPDLGFGVCAKIVDGIIIESYTLKGNYLMQENN